MKKILAVFCLLFSTQTFAQEIFIHLTDRAQSKIDCGIDRWMYGPTNTNAFNIILTILPLEESSPKVYCGFRCAQPYRSTQSNCQIAFTPSFNGNTLEVTYNPDILSPALIGHSPEIQLTCSSSTCTLKNIKKPDAFNFELKGDTTELTIDFSDAEGFFIIGDHET